MPHPVPELPSSTRAWHRRVWSLSWPIILANSSVPLVGAVDTAVVGHLPSPSYIGAVALGAIIFNFLFWGFGFLRMGTTGLVAQAYGARNFRELEATSIRALLLGLGLGALIIVVNQPLAALAFTAMEGSEEVEGLAASYYAVRVWSAPAALANYSILGLLIGVQRPRSALVVQLVLNGINLVLDVAFVVGLGWGVAGVAAASLVSEYVALGLGLWIVLRQFRGKAGRARIVEIWDLKRLQALLKINLDLFIRTLCLISAFFYFTSQGARLGDITLAANAILMHFLHFLAFGLDGFAHAAEALAGSAFGARDRSRFRAAVRASTGWAVVVAVGYAGVYLVLGQAFVAGITDIDAVRVATREFLPWIIASPLVSVWSYQLDGIFIGTTRTADMRNAMIVSLAVFLAAVWALSPQWGNHGLWAALMIFMIARAATLGLRYPSILRALRPADDMAP